jgi:hypothetical protein
LKNGTKKRFFFSKKVKKRSRPGQNVLKLFSRNLLMFVISLSVYPNHASPVFVLGNPFKPSLMFADKARAYPTEPAFTYSNNRAGSSPYPQTLDYAGKACQEQTL